MMADYAVCTNQMTFMRASMKATATSETPTTTVLQRERSMRAQNPAASGITMAVRR
jgi:hypothetical protein